MPDITMCNGKIHGHGDDWMGGTDTCPFRDRCLRYTAVPDPYWQSQFEHAPIVDGECEYFIDNEKRGGRRPKKVRDGGTGAEEGPR